jgi:hypothetical protein
MYGLEKGSATRPLTVEIAHRGVSSGMIHPSIQRQMQTQLPLPLQNILAAAAIEAKRRGWQLYLIGGAVRDLLLARTSGRCHLQELDLVVDSIGTPQSKEAGAKLGQALIERYPEAHLQVYGRFQIVLLMIQPGFFGLSGLQFALGSPLNLKLRRIFELRSRAVFTNRQWNLMKSSISIFGGLRYGQVWANFQIANARFSSCAMVWRMDIPAPCRRSVKP